MELINNMAEEQNSEVGIISFVNKHSFKIFITTSIIISFIIVNISMFLYYGSGAAQLDLSRPGYQDVRDKIEVDDGEFYDYPDSGPMNDTVIDDFKVLYEKYVRKVKLIDAFGGDPLSPKELGIIPTTE